ALGRAGGAGGVGDLRRAGRQRQAGRRALTAPELADGDEAQRGQSAGERPFGQGQGGAALLQAVGALRRAEERRQDQAGDAGAQRRQVPYQYLAAVVQGQGQQRHLQGTQLLRTGLYLTPQLGVIDLALAVAQGQGGGALHGVVLQRREQGIRPHGAPPHNWSA